MFKRIAIAVTLVLALTATAKAEVNGVYGGLKFIDSIQSTGNVSKNADYFGIDSYSQNTIGGGIFLGYDFYQKFDIPFRVEVEYDLRTSARTEWDGSKNGRHGSIEAEWNVQTLFANVYWDMHNSTKFTPYIGGGLGMGFINSSYDIHGRNGEEFSMSDMKTVFAWNVGAGCSYAFTENISADLAYRYVGLGENKVDDTLQGFDTYITTHPSMHEFSLGVRFTF